MSTTRFDWSTGRIDHDIAKPIAIALKVSRSSSTFASGPLALNTTRIKKSPVSTSSNCWASRMLNPPSNRAAATFATIPGRLTQDKVSMWRLLDTRAPYDDPQPKRRRRPLSVRLLQQRLDRRQNLLNDDLDPLRVRVQTVRLVELRIARYAIKEERIKQNIVTFRQGRIDGGELGRVFTAEVGSSSHAGEEHGQMGGSGLIQYRRERLLRCLGLHAPQHVVAPELDDQRVGVFRHRPIVASEAVRSRVAGDAGVDDLDVPTLGAERRFEAIGKRLARRQAVSSCQAVAQGHKTERARRSGVRGRRQDRHERHRLDE